jgi:hypothetical protein
MMGYDSALMMADPCSLHIHLEASLNSETRGYCLLKLTYQKMTNDVINNDEATGLPDLTLSEQCQAIRKTYCHTSLYMSTMGFISGVLVFVRYLLRWECIVSMGLSVGLTIYVYRITDNDLNFDGGSMSWTLLTFAVVTPLTSSVGMAFTRREQALKYLRTIRSTVIQLYLAHSSWDWTNREKPETGRKASKGIDWVEYADDVLDELLALVEELRLLLLLPTSSRSRHKVTPTGIREAKAIDVMSSKIHSLLMRRMGTMSAKCEFLKLHGMPGNEASRIRQWEQFVTDAIEGLNMIKCYRTPQALRSYSRLLSVIVPPFFAPYYADLARSTGSLTLAGFYAALTALALTGLFECVTQLEDPFFGHATLDGVNVDKELGPSLRDHLLVLRGQIFPGERIFGSQ